MTAIRASYQMTGVAALTQRMEKLRKELTDRPIKAGLRAAGKVVKQAVIAAAPFDGQTPDGVHIRENIVVARSRQNSSPGVEVFTVAVKYGRKKLGSGKSVKTEGDAFYWKFLEFGSSHQAAQPFIRPAFQATEQAQVAAFEKAMERAIARLERLP